MTLSACGSQHSVVSTAPAAPAMSIRIGTGFV
jgi:hypothetical protein